MARQDQANEQFSGTSFLYGGNADYIERLYAAWQENPASVDPQWQDVFASLKDDATDIRRNADGRLLAAQELADHRQRRTGLGARRRLGHRPEAFREEGEGRGGQDRRVPAALEQSARDSVRAIMMIRAYRMRGHLHANLDPLGLAEAKEDYNELSPEAYGFTEADYDRPIFIDNVLGLERATIRQMLDILKRTYCSTIGVEFMHISNPTRRAGSRSASRVRTRASPSPRKARRRSCPSSSNPRASSSSSTSSTRAPSASVSTAANR